MANQVDNKFTWVIKDFSSLQSEVIVSDTFVIGGCKWFLGAFPKGENIAENSLSLCLEVSSSEFLPCGWRRDVKFSLTVVNQSSEKLSHLKETHQWFDEESINWGFPSMLPLSELHAKDGGFLVNDELKIVAEIDVLEVIGGLDETEDGVESQELRKETIDINGFQVLPFQEEVVKHIFEKHPDVAVGFRSKNSHLKKSCMNSLLCLIDTLCQSPQDLSYEDLVEADIVLAYVKDAGFKVDWLEEKMCHVKIKKKDEQTSEVRMRELEKELKELKQKISEVEDMMEKEKANVIAARASLTLDDIIMT